MRLLALLISAVLLCCPAVQAQVRTYDEMIAAGELKVAVYKDFAPYSFEDAGKGRGVDVDLASALAATADVPKVFVIGGGELYAQALPLADELVLTEVDADFDADTFFPAWDRAAFTEVSRETHTAEAGWPYHFVVYQRRK